MTGDSHGALQRVLEAWDREGASGARDAIWALAPEHQARVAVELYNERAIEAMLAAIPDEFVHDMRPTGIPGMELYHGSAGYRRFLNDWLDAFPESNLVTESAEASENWVLAVVRQEMRGAGSRVPVQFHYAALIRFRDGRAIESEFHTDLPRARERFATLTAGLPR